MLNRFFNEFTPTHIKEDAAAYSRAKNILGTAVIAMIAIPAYAFIYYMLNDIQSAVVILIEGIIIASAVFLLKYTGSIFWSGKLIVISLIASLIILSYSLGGITSSVAFWFILPPLVAFFLSGGLAGIIASLLCITAVTVLFGLEHFNIPFPISMITNTLLLQLLSIIGLMIVIVSLAYFFERSAVENAEDVLKTNRKLRKTQKMAEKLRLKSEHETAEKLAIISNSETKFRSILEGAPDAIVLTNKESEIVIANAQTQKLFGYTKPELIGQHIELLIPERYHEKYAGYRNSYFADPKANTTGASLELHGLRKDNSEFPVEIRFSPVATEEELLVMTSIRDLTDKKYTESMLMEKNAQLEHANLAKDQFLSHMSHELRTPLNGIITMTQLLMTSTLTEEQQEQLAIVHESEEQLLAVINQILDFSKVEAGKIEVEYIAFNLREVIKKTLTIYKIKAKIKNIALNSDISDEVPDRFIGDSVKIRQALSNLLDNAVKFTESGQIDVTVSVAKKTETETTLLFEVSDTGIGIKPEMFPRLFVPFSQGDNSLTRKYGGTGLGLAICKRLIEAMGGTIQVVSKGRGSQFKFTVPLIENKKLFAEDNITPVIAPKIADADQQNAHILLVEDNKLNQKTLAMILEKYGFQVTIVSDGIEALDVLNKNTYDVILMDCQMPNMDGYVTTMEIRKKEQESNDHVPIIGVTAHALESDKKKCIYAGMDAYVSKPFNVEELHKLIMTFIKKS